MFSNLHSPASQPASSNCEQSRQSLPKETTCPRPCKTKNLAEHSHFALLLFTSPLFLRISNPSLSNDPGWLAGLDWRTSGLFVSFFSWAYQTHSYLNPVANMYRNMCRRDRSQRVLEPHKIDAFPVEHQNKYSAASHTEPGPNEPINASVTGTLRLTFNSNINGRPALLCVSSWHVPNSSRRVNEPSNEIKGIGSNKRSHVASFGPYRSKLPPYLILK